MAAAIGSISATCASLTLNSLKQTARPSAQHPQTCSVAPVSSCNTRRLKGQAATLCSSDALSVNNANVSKTWRAQAARSVVGIRAAAITAPPTYKTLKPLGDRVLVKIQSVEEKTKSGIILPASSQTKPQIGEVIEVGEGKKVGDKKLPPCVQAGNTIVYSKYAGTEIQFNGSDHILLKEDDVIGLLATDDIKDLKPLNDRVLIKVAEAEDKTAGGVLLTDTAKEKPVIGEVHAVGPGSYGEDGNRKPLEVSNGNTVLYSKYAGNDFKSKDGSQFVVLRVSDVLAILS